MRTIILGSSPDFAREFERCCREYSTLRMAIAWCGDPAQGNGHPFRYLREFKGKITATIGCAFDQTHPDGIEFFRTIKADIRIFHEKICLFHPKVYLFASKTGKALFIGSSNLTNSGFYKNAEVNLLLEGTGSWSDHDTFGALREQLDAWHSDGFSQVPSRLWMKRYRKRHEAARKTARRSGSLTALAYEEETPSAGWLASATWDTYFQAVAEGLNRREEEAGQMVAFLKVAGSKLRLPFSTAYFSALEKRKIMGGIEPYGWFGHIGASGRLKGLLKSGTKKQHQTIADSLNAITELEFPIDWQKLDALLSRLVKLGFTMKVWSRFLCLLRPDLYCTISSPSVRRNLSEVLAIPQNRFQSTQGYIALLKLLHATPWFQAHKPGNPDERMVWQYRSAMLDAIFYD